MTVYPEILVEGGTFLMGGDKYDREKPIHTVTLNDFWIGKFLVTFEWYDLFCKELERPLPKDSRWGRGQRPVIWVNWFDTLLFCNWLSLKKELTAVYLFNNKKIYPDWTATGYRLPTEAEWEYVARGGAKSNNFIYAGGNKLRKIAWHIGNANDKSQPVGQKLPNELGIHDMSGNVWEWCWDWLDENYYQMENQTHPKGPDSGGFKVIRGGSWYSVPKNLRVAHRFCQKPINQTNSIGFRVARNRLIG